MKIQQYRFGHLEIDGDVFAKDVLLLPPRVLSPWWRQQGHRLDMADLEDVMSYRPEVLIIGTGAHQRLEVPADTAQYLRQRIGELLVVPTEQACDLVNTLLSEGRRIAAGLHLTC